MIGCFLVLTTYVVFAIVAGLSICSFFGHSNWTFEMLSNFRIAFIAALGGSVLMFMLLRRPVGFVVASCLFVINAWGLVPFYLKEQPTAQAEGRRLKVLQFNVRGGQNHDFDKTLQVIRRENPDLIGISEITKTWNRVLLDKLKQYPYRITEPQLGGIALFSKYPLKNQEIRYFESIRRPRITADVVVAGQSIRILMVHPVIPLVAARMRDRELEIYENEMKATRMPIVLFGDLNTTPWSYYFDHLMKAGNLHDTEKGFGYHPTWPVGRAFFPIDHCLVTDDFYVVDRRVLESVGSDHFPVVVELSLHKKGS